MQAITQGEQGQNCAPGGADPPGENGPWEPDADVEAGPAVEVPPGPYLGDAIPPRPRHDG